MSESPNNESPKRTIPPLSTEIQVLMFCSRHDWITPTLCESEGIFSNRGSAWRKLRELCEQGLLSENPNQRGHYCQGFQCFEMNLASTNRIVLRLERATGVAMREVSLLQQLLEAWRRIVELTAAALEPVEDLVPEQPQSKPSIFDEPPETPS